MRTQLYAHNKTAYQKVVKAFETSDRTCVVHPTGTGKSYLIAAVSESYQKVLILGPNIFVLDQVHDVLKWRDSKKVEGTVEYMTYSLLMMKDVMPTGYDLICLDEFHRAGAPEWGDAVDRLLEANPQAKVLGTTATPIRFLDDNRDMADELFGGNIASYMTLKDAFDRDILATPRFVTGLFEFDRVADDMAERVSRSRRIDDKEKRQRLTRINNLRLDWERSQGMPHILRKHIDKTAKRIIVFCGNVEKLKDMEQTITEWFRLAGIKVAAVYMMHAYMPDKELSQAMTDFETDTDDGVKLMLSVNMLNEGVHIPRVNAVILLRTTSSKIIYLQQIGRCLTAEKKDKPIILDMVDNITTTNIVHDIKEGFDWYAHQQLRDEEEREPREPKDFVVYDYTLGIQQAIEKLVPDSYFRTYDELLAMVADFCEKNGRAPSRKDGDIHQVWVNLTSHHKDKPEFKALYEKYSRSQRMSFHERKARLMDFVSRFDRLPNNDNDDREERNNLTQLRRLNQTRNDAELNEVFASYAVTYTDEQIKQRILDFYKEHGRMPIKGKSKEENRLHASLYRRRDVLYNDPDIAPLLAEYKKEVPQEEKIRLMQEFTAKNGRKPTKNDGGKLWQHWNLMVKYGMDDPRVKDLVEKYGPKELDLKEYMEPLVDFLRENHRRPSTLTTEYEKHLYSIIVNLRKNYSDRPDVRPLLEEIDALPKAGEQKQARNDEWVRREIVAFTDLHHRMPKTRSGDKAETTLARLWASRRDRLCQDDPQMQAILDQYDKRPMKFEERYAMIRDWAAEHDRLPRKADGDIFQAYDTLRRSYYNVPEVQDLLRKYGARPSQPKTDIDARLDQIEAFANEHGRLPSTAHSDELQLARRWHNIKRRYGMLPRVVTLCERFPIQNRK